MRTALLISLLGIACSKSPPPPPAEVTVPTVTVDEVDHMLATHSCQPVDANGTPTRKRMGVLPSAILLTDYDNLDKLPADKTANLVFYCVNEGCTSSHDAAAKAIATGYQHVEVMPAGIAGWVKAGKQTSSI